MIFLLSTVSMLAIHYFLTNISSGPVLGNDLRYAFSIKDVQ